MGATDDDLTARIVAAGSALVLAGGVFMGLFIISTAGQAVLAFLMLSVVPALLGYAGLERAGHLPWQDGQPTGGRGGDDDLLDELKRRYAAGDIDDAELERRVETLLSASEQRPRQGASERDRDRKRTREPETVSP